MTFEGIRRALERVECATQDHQRRRRGERGKHRLIGKKRRDQQKRCETDEQRSVASRACLEKLDAAQHEQKCDAGLTTQEVSVPLPDAECDGDREEGKRPWRRLGERGNVARTAWRYQKHA